VSRPVISHTSSALDVPGSIDPQAPLLRVYTLGAFHLDWQVPPFTTEDLWKSRTSARTLFKLLLCAPDRQASRSQLAGILWPETDEDKARESLRSASKVVRKVLRTASGEELLENRNNSTILKLAEQVHLWVDADAFEDLVAQASRATAPEEALALWQQALRLARGRMVRHMADLYLQHGQYSLAEEVLEQHLVRFPTDQDALYRLLALLEQQGSFEEARLLYQRARRTLETLGKQPAPRVRTRYERLQEASISQSDFPTLHHGSASRGQAHPPVSSSMPQDILRRELEDAERTLMRTTGNMPFLQESEGASDGTMDVLRVLLEAEQEGRSGLPLFSRRQGLELGIVALISRLAQLDGTRVSVIEREAVNRALSESIMDGWKRLFLLENAQIVAIGRAQLALIHQPHTLVSASALPYFYAGAHSFLGIGLHFQVSMHAFGAQFAEVRVNEDTGEVRVPRLLGVFAAGRIVNPKTARSQLLGGMTWGLSMALHAASVLDPRFGDYVNHDLAEYHIATNADVGSIEVAWIEDDDPHVNPMGVKGIGELGIVGTAAAIANAVYHATGIRVRDLPITLDKLLS
jgi:DNA-binding SARP family transcriptional activator